MSKFVFALALALAVAYAATNASAAGDVSAPRLSRIASAFVPNTRVTVHAFGCAGRVRACTDMTAGMEQSFEDGSHLIQLAPDVAKALRSIRVAAPPYPRSSTGEAIFTLAHEIGHASGNHSEMDGLWEEARADCYAAKHWRSIAARLGFKRSQLPALARQIDGGIGAGKCWGPYAGGGL